MRNFFCIILVCCSGIYSVAQNDTIFPNVSASWYVKTWTYGDFGIEYDHYECEMLNDTIDTLGFQWQSMVDGNSSLVGLVRVDSGKVIYQGLDFIGFGLGHYYDGDTMVVMYDFNLEVGDTSTSLEPMILDSITITNFLGVPKRTFHWSGIDLAYDDTWVEGMGSVNGFFRPVMNTFELGIILCSYSGQYLDSLALPYNLTYDNPDICEQLSIVNFQNEISTLKGPNWIQLETLDESFVSIYSLSGQIVHESTLPSGTNRIELSFLQKGLYIINVGNFHFEKIIIM